MSKFVVVFIAFEKSKELKVTHAAPKNFGEAVRVHFQ